MSDQAVGTVSGIIAMGSQVANAAFAPLEGIPFAQIFPTFLKGVVTLVNSPQLRFYVKYIMYQIWRVLPPSVSERMTVSQDQNNIVVRDRLTNQPLTGPSTSGIPGFQLPGLPTIPALPNLPSLPSFPNLLPNFPNLLPNQQNTFNPSFQPNNMLPNQFPNQFPYQQNLPNIFPNQQQNQFPNSLPNMATPQPNFGENFATASPQSGNSIPNTTQAPFNPFDIFGKRR